MVASGSKGIPRKGSSFKSSTANINLPACHINRQYLFIVQFEVPRATSESPSTLDISYASVLSEKDSATSIQDFNISDVTDNGSTKPPNIEDDLYTEIEHSHKEHCQDADDSDADTESTTGMEERCNNPWCNYGMENDGLERDNVWYCTKCTNDSQTWTVCNKCLHQYGHHKRHKCYLKDLPFS